MTFLYFALGSITLGGIFASLAVAVKTAMLPWPLETRAILFAMKACSIYAALFFAFFVGSFFPTGYLVCNSPQACAQIDFMEMLVSVRWEAAGGAALNLAITVFTRKLLSNKGLPS